MLLRGAAGWSHAALAVLLVLRFPWTWRARGTAREGGRTRGSLLGVWPSPVRSLQSGVVFAVGEGVVQRTESHVLLHLFLRMRLFVQLRSRQLLSMEPHASVLLRAAEHVLQLLLRQWLIMDVQGFLQLLWR